MGEADLSEDVTCKRQEGLPSGGRPPQTKLCDDHRPASENHTLGVSDRVSSAAGDAQGAAARKETCTNADTAPAVDRVHENTVEEKHDKGQRCTTGPPLPAGGDPPKSNISDILQHHLSKEEFLKGEGIDCETLPEVSSADSSGEAVVKSVLLRYVQSSWPEEQAPEPTGQLDPKRGDERGDQSGAKPSRSPTAAEATASELGEPAAAGDGSRAESSDFLSEAKSPSHRQEGGRGQTPRHQQTEKAGSGLGCQGDRVHGQFSDFSRVAPTGKIPEHNVTNEPLPTDTQDHFSRTLRDRLALVRDILESLSGSNGVEEEEQGRKAPDPPRETEMEPTRHVHQERVAGTESETSLFTLTPASQKNPPASSSYIFQKISQGKKMCQKLREQTDRLKSKVQEFSKSMARDSPRHVRDQRLALEELQGHLALLEQELVANKEKHLTWKQQARKHDPPAVSDLDPEREAEGAMFRLEMLLEEVKEKRDQGECTPASPPPASSPAAAPADLAPASSPRSDERDPRRPSGRQKRAERAEMTGWSCVFCRRVLEWKQNVERRGHRRSGGGRLPAARSGQALRRDSSLSPDTDLSCCSASGTGLRGHRCETCGTEVPNSPRGRQKEPLGEFHYRYNTPGQNCSNHEGGSAFVQLRFLNENKNSSPSCSKPNWIYSESADSKPSQDEHEPIPGKNNLTAFMAYGSALASSSPHFHSRGSSGSKSSGNLSCIEETKSEGLNSSLDNALRTAIVLKETTDRMIRTIAEDLAKLQRWRNRLKY
ncbi:protein AKNAD1 [Phyllostomus hastatus]|uniref:protein AKNAD1 n=1 Tax=Phyllostomus hastatus TaxID=9423 RepID=UPI001E67E01C|nr:protein AKNAD1 [Phyllostomus hastatus]